MFFKLSLLSTLATLASALTLNAPQDAVVGRNVTVSWSDVGSTPVFTLQLHHPSFNNDFALANNVDPNLNSITFVMPEVEEQSDYTFRAVNISDITQVYAETGNFRIVNQTTASSTEATATATSPTGSASQTGTQSGSQSASTSGSGAPSSTTSADGQNGGNGALSLGINGAAAALVAGVLGVAALF
ncbi:hypothetical protein PM082_009756 [Marasmius tenuissimus]|nr:hypothetical protein PM082_009756 [Marasmius tenuissimus]